MVDELKQWLYMEGIDIFGTSDVSKNIPERFSETPYAVTLGIRLSDTVINEVKKGPTKIYFQHYRTSNAFLDMCALKCVMWLQRRGYDAVAIPASQSTSEAGLSADFPHKTAANLAGLGFVGKSALFVTTDFGPRVRLATVLTNFAVPSGSMQSVQCASCRLCVDACPCGAITGQLWTSEGQRSDMVDAALCSRYMKKAYRDIGRGAVCGICMAVCPCGTKGQFQR